MRDMKEAFLRDRADGLSAGRIGRREFLTAVLAAGVALPAAMAMADKAMAAAPKRGGRLRLGLGHGSTTDSLDPGTYENGFSTFLGYCIGNHLTEIGPDGQLRPELAESYESMDAKTWVFRLRKGVEFHNGKTLAPEDVIASLQHHMGEDSKSAAKGLLEPVVEMKAEGDSVVVVLATANAGFPTIVSDYHLQIMPSKDGKVDPHAGVASGGYALESYEPGVRAAFKRHPNYWKADAAWVDEVEMLSLLDVTARQSALLNGEVDVIDRVDPKTVGLMARNPNIKILETVGTLHYTFPMRVDTPPFDNIDVRTALKLAIRRQELVDKILLGHGALGNDHPISTANQFHAGGLPQREFDPEQAAALYKKSGHSGPIQLSTSEAAFAGAVDAAQLIAASARECGIEIEVVREPKDGYWSNVWNKKPWSACYWGGRPTEDWMFSAAYIDSTEWNDTAWRDTDGAKKFNRIVVEARAELDVEKRRALYFEAQRLIRDDGGAVVPMFANYIHGLAKTVGHAEDVAGNWSLDGNKAAERWWFA